MPSVALALCALWFVSLFVLRSVVQLRRTGSTGVKGFHGPVGSIPWIAGVSASVGLFLAPLGPLAALLDWPGGDLLASSESLHLLGAVFAVLGIVGGLVAQLSMGDSWRVGVDATETTELVTTGPFAWVRNPIFTFIGVSLLGLVFLVPNPPAIAAAAFTMLGIELQVRAVEEPYLASTHGEEYRRYASRVGRFVPRLGRLADG